MKKLLLLAFLLPASLWAFQKSGNQAPKKPSGTVSLICRVYGVPANVDTIFLFENLGLANRIVARSARRGVDSAYVITIPASTPKFYLVGASEMSTAKVILGEEKEVTLWGNSQFMGKARTVNSPVNTGYEKLQTQIAALQTEGLQLRQQLSRAGAGARSSAEAELKTFGKTKAKFLDSLKMSSPTLWRIACLHLTPDYMGQGAESDFYGKEYFRNADLTDKSYEGIPEVFNAFEAYINQLLNVGTGQDKLMQLAEEQLAKIPAESRTYRMAMGGIISALKNNNSPKFPELAKKYIDKYTDNNLGELSRLKMDVRIAASQLTGYEAPELEGMTPDSSHYSLKQLRGKVVMIDFWASWCGPCRKENPNVVVNYNKYKDKGFDILGVSLDRDISAWRKAIEADGLKWHHISDLKGWQSSHAALYSITSIPQTLLLDREGKIIARNLRGEQLSEKLKEIFGM